jgi:hypothetical protein
VDTVQRHVLTLRAGLGGRAALSSSQVAHRLDLGAKQEQRIEHAGLHRLVALGHDGRCGAGTSRAADGVGVPASSSTALPGASALSTGAVSDRATGAVGAVKGVVEHGGDDRAQASPFASARPGTLLPALMLAAALGVLVFAVRRERRRYR